MHRRPGTSGLPFAWRRTVIGQKLAVLMDVAFVSVRPAGWTAWLRDEGVVLEGQTHTYYAKQLAQHAGMEAIDLPILANEIEVV